MPKKYRIEFEIGDLQSAMMDELLTEASDNFGFVIAAARSQMTHGPLFRVETFTINGGKLHTKTETAILTALEEESLLRDGELASVLRSLASRIRKIGDEDA
jgi:hypothetical protein